MSAYQVITAPAQMMWHLSVAIHHVQAALDHGAAREVLPLEEYQALENVGHAICDMIDHLVDIEDTFTDAP
jgi:hypothetical protein